MGASPPTHNNVFLSFMMRFLNWLHESSPSGNKLWPLIVRSVWVMIFTWHHYLLNHILDQRIVSSSKDGMASVIICLLFSCDFLHFSL